MTELHFEVTFHSPFRVSAGYNREGVGVVTPHDPLPSYGLKGVMRATAATLLGDRALSVREVFGSGSRPSPWKWSSATPDEAGWSAPRTAARVSIDPETNTARHDMLTFDQQTGAHTASFTITQREEVADPTTHVAVLAIAAQSTRSLGALRRRGLGWVGIRCTNHEITEDDVRRFLELRADV